MDHSPHLTEYEPTFVLILDDFLHDMASRYDIPINSMYLFVLDNIDLVSLTVDNYLTLRTLV